MPGEEVSLLPRFIFSIGLGVQVLGDEIHGSAPSPAVGTLSGYGYELRNQVELRAPSFFFRARPFPCPRSIPLLSQAVGQKPSTPSGVLSPTCRHDHLQKSGEQSLGSGGLGTRVPVRGFSHALPANDACFHRCLGTCPHVWPVHVAGRAQEVQYQINVALLRAMLLLQE